MIGPADGLLVPGPKPGGDGERRFLLASDREAGRIAHSLTQGGGAQTRTGSSATRIYMDTPDGRLRDRGERLWTTSEGRVVHVTWASGGPTDRVLVLGSVPAFATDLPPGPFRAALAGVIAERRLMSIARVEEARPALDVVDGRGKTVVRVAFERWSAAKRTRAARRRPLFLRVTPVRGYRKPFERLLASLATLGDLPLQEAGEPIELLGLARLGSRKPQLGLHPEMRTDEASKQILLAELAVIEANEEGTREATDPEFLHEYRVAMRKTRVALARFKGVFPVRTTERFKREFKWLSEVTGSARDLDVYLLELPAYAECVTSAASEHLAPLRPYLQRRCEAAYAELGRTFRTQRYRRLLTDWRAFLERPVSPRTQLEAARIPVGAHANRLIWKMHSRVLKQGGAIDDATPDEAVHDLRLACKKLRYLMEFFRSLYPARETKDQLKALKRLQALLGEFNDLSVQQGSLMATAAGMSSAGVAPLETVVALGRLVEVLAARQREARRLFHARFDEFASDENRARARRLFRSRPQGAPA